MPNEYLSLVQNDSAPGGNPYLDMMQNEKQSIESQFRATTTMAVGTDPDRMALDKRVASYLGTTPPVVQALPQDAERAAKLKQIDDNTKAAPVLRQKYSDEDFARIAHDDSSVLSSIETLFGALKNSGKALASSIPKFNEGMWGLGQSAFEAISPVGDVLAGTILPENPFARVAAGMAEQRRVSKEMGDRWMPKSEGVMAGGWYSGLQSFGQNMLLLPAAVLSGNPGVALAPMVASTGGQAYGEARDKGYEPFQSLTYGASQAVIEYATEKLPMGLLIKDLKVGSPLYKTLMHQAITEVPGEQIATVLQDMNEWAVLHPEKPFSSYLEERPSAAAQTLIATLVGVGGNVAVGHVAEKVLGTEAEHKQRLQDAEAQKAMLDQLNTLAEQSKLKARDQETFQQFVEATTDGTPAQDLYISANTLMQSGVAEQVAELLPSVKEQLPAALASDSYVRIPTAEYAAAVSGTELNQALIDHVKTDPNGYTFSESQQYAQTFNQEMQTQMERLMVEKQGDEAFKASRDQVRDDFLVQLNQAKRFTPEVNTAYATMLANFYAVTAAKLGMTPQALVERYKLNVVNQEQQAAQYDQDGKLITDSENFRNWYGEWQNPGNGTLDGRGSADVNSLQREGEVGGNPAGGLAVGNITFPGTSGPIGRDGKPVVFFHGTRDNVHAFDTQHPNRKDKGWLGRGVYVASDSQDAETYSRMKRGNENPTILPLFVAVKNPYVADITVKERLKDASQEEIDAFTQGLKDQGFDGVVMPFSDGHVELMAFDPTNVKSVFNNGNFDPTDSNILHQDAKEEGKNAITGDLDRVNQAVREAVEAHIAKLPAEDQERIRSNLEEHKGTAWAAAAVKGMAYREMLERALAGQDISELERNDIWGKQDMAATAIIKTFKKSTDVGPKILKAFLQQYDFIGGNRKAENDISTSFSNCDPSKACAVHCYAAGSNARPSEIAKSEFTEFMIANFPEEMAEKIAGDYLATAAGKAGLSLRLNDKGDLSPAQVKLINLLNERDVPVQVFSKRPELLRQLSDMNLKMLSVDGTNIQLAYDNPDLRLAVVITDEMTEADLVPIHDRVSVYLPVNLKGKAITSEELKARFPGLFKRMRSENLCPVDGGKLVTKPGTSFVDIRDRTADKGTWTCTSCDLFGNAGCFKGDRQTNQRKAKMQVQAISLSDVKKELAIKKAKQELEKQLDLLLQLGGLDEQQRRAISEALSQGQRDLQSDAERAAKEGDAAGPGGTVGQGAEGAAGIRGPDGRTGKGGTTLNQGNAPRGQIHLGQDITKQPSVIALLQKADLSTFIHESGHFFLEVQLDLASRIAGEAEAFGHDTNSEGERQLLEDSKKLLDWFGVQSLQEWYNLTPEEKRSYHEKFARGFEAYAFEGRAPTMELQGLFQRFRSWLVNIYRELKSLNVELTDDVRGVMDRMLATTEQIQAAETARNMGPLFNPANAQGLIDDWKAYHDLANASTAEAIDELQAKSLKDMQWLSNARARILRELQKKHDALRAEVQIEARREIMSQPVYRAWQFLTGKLSKEDKEAVTPEAPRKSVDGPVDETIDSLFVAIAKMGGLDREQVRSQWGLFKDERSPMPLFGKPVVRKTDGLGLDEMGERLAELGYLPKDEHGKYDIADFEAAFDSEYRGMPVFSYAHDYAESQGEQRPGEGVDLESLGAGRLDLVALKDLGLPSEIVEHLVNLKMTAKDGIAPDLVAESFGFTSGDELVRTLAIAQDPKVAIKELTDQKMLERHGELANQEAIKQQADMAVHNELRARVLQAEARALDKALGLRQETGESNKKGQAKSYAILPKAAREFAERLVSRLKVRDIRPGQYAAAEVKAAREAERAYAKGDIEAAAEQKRNQIINNYATRAAYQAQEEVRKAVAYLRKFEKKSKALDGDYYDQIVQMLERFDLVPSTSLKTIDRRTSLANWLKSQEEAGFVPEMSPELEAEAYRKSYKDMTVEEIRGLRDTIKQIEHLGRLKQSLLTAKDQRDFDTVRDEMVNSINAHAGDRQADNRTPNTVLGEKLLALKNFWASHIKAATWARIMDGGKDGGPVWEYLIRTANAAGDKEVGLREEATKELSALVAPVLAQGKMGGKGTFFPSVGRSFNKEARLAIALNMGNASNMQRLLGGEGWNLQQVKPILDTLTTADWRFVQSVWDYFESYRPEIGAKQRRVYGTEPAWIEPQQLSVQTADGDTLTLRGGYYPVKYDPRSSERAEAHMEAENAKRMMQGAYTSATTRRSFTKGRVEEVNGRPLLYSLDGIYNGVNEVIHDLSWHEWLIDANRLIKNPKIAEAMRDAYGADVHNQFKNWIKDIAEGDKGAQNAGEKALAWMRQGTSIAGLGINVMSALLQPFGITQSMVRVGSKWIGKGVAKTIADPIGTNAEICEMSEFMRTRGLTRMRELAELRNQVKGQTKTRANIDAAAYALMMRAQQLVDIPTWWGAYEKATAEGNGEDRAVALADQAVIDAQGSGTTKDLAAIERGGPALKLFTVFYSFMNTALNLGVGQTMTSESKSKLAADYLLIYVVPVVLIAAMKSAFTPGDSGDWDDPKKITMKLIKEEISYMMGLFFGVRELSGIVDAFNGSPLGSYSGPAGTRLVADTMKLAKEVGQGNMDDGLRKSVINVAGELLRLPSAQINRTVTGAKAMTEGKTHNPAALLFGYEEPH